MPWDKQFDKSEVLEKATHAFWANGYDGTPMAELLEQMGIQKGSFYATFGSKHQIYLDVLDGYVRQRFAQVGHMDRAPSPRTELEKHFRWIAEEALSETGENGCLVVNAAIELAPKDEEVQQFVQKTFDKHIGLYRAVLEAAQAMGECPATLDTLATGRTLFALVLGIRVLARAGMPRAVILAVRDQALALISGKSESGV